MLLAIGAAIVLQLCVEIKAAPAHEARRRLYTKGIQAALPSNGVHLSSNRLQILAQGLQLSKHRPQHLLRLRPTTAAARS